jgi:ABC-2 type transport system ATP-binding protein
LIRLEHVSKRFKTVTAVRDISFEVQKGEILGFLGPNAAGKTTTMRMITGYLPATQGRISVAGYDIFHHPREAKRRIGYLPENVPLYQELTVEGYLGHRARLMGIPRGDRAAAIKRVVNSCALEKVAQDHVRKLSKGFRQRLGLAQALLHDPEVLILDEPLSGMDVTSSLLFKYLLDELARRGKMILYISHVLEVVEKVCARVIVIHKGRIMAEDSVERLRELMNLTSLEAIFNELIEQRDLESVARDIVSAIQTR